MKYLISLSFIVLLQGCSSYYSLTAGMWDKALCPTIGVTEIKGVVKGSHENEYSHLIVELSSIGFWQFEFTHSHYYVAIPLKNNQLPDPMEFHGQNERSLDRFLDLTDNQIEDVFRTKFSRESYALGKRLIKSKSYVQANGAERGLFCPPHPENPNVISNTRRASIEIIPYWWNDKTLNPYEKKGSDMLINNKCQIALFPPIVGRFRSDYYGGIVITSLLTPLTLTVDVVVIPYTFVRSLIALANS